MRPGRTSDSNEGNVEITLGVLNAVDGDSRMTQRALSRNLGIALGLTNAYLKRCVKKGLIKVSQVPPNRYAYYLTPKGFSEKSRLTAEYLSSSFGFFRRARLQCGEALDICRANRWTRIALAGNGELAEIATLCAAERGVGLVGIVGARRQGGLAAIALDEVRARLDAVIVTEMRAPQEAFEQLTRQLPTERVLTPPLLHVSRSGRAVP